MTTLKRSFARWRFLQALVLLLVVPVTNAATVLYPFGGADNSNAREPFGLDDVGVFTCRYQQVYDASRFAAVLPYGGVITQMYFIVDNEFPRWFNTTFPDIQIDFSVTLRGSDNLSTNFSENLGTNTVAVIPRGSLVIRTTGGNPIIVNLIVPFFYNPAEGNLLLDIRKFTRVPSGNPLENPSVFEAQDTLGDSVSRIYSYDVNSTSGVADTIGLKTYFKVIPPPVPRLVVRVFRDELWLSWFRVPRDFTLEQSSILGPDALWQPAGGLVGGGGEDSILVRVPLFPPDAGRFFRLVSTNHPSFSAPAGLNTNQPALLNPPD